MIRSILKMKAVLLSAALLFSILSQASFHIVGYFTTWAGNVNTIQYSKLTHINYAFILPTSTGGLTTLSNPSRLQSLCSLAHVNNVKVLIAVGGWNNGNDSNFETVAANSTKRTTFVTNLLNFVSTYNLDGVDIDWEYPDPGTSADNYALLMHELSDSLHNRGKLLTAAVVNRGAQGAGVKDEVFGYVDFLNIMAYDAGTPHSTYSEASQSMDYWLGRGLPASKAVLGVPFYGRDPYTAYSTLVSQDASAPYKDNVGSTYYNGINTIKNKTIMARNKGTGVMIWDITMDTNDNTSLLKAIYDNRPLATNIPIEDKSFQVFPNPANETITINYSSNSAEDLDFTICDILGEEKFSGSMKGTIGEIEEKIKVDFLPDGIYMVRIKEGDRMRVKKFVKH
ncbi:MAG: T9SS type A sorting domain-containing protein [Cytophagaceae bacterium]|nr:T9SS type A sorting domain-containing protein [Cytophagaceae bacterium]